MRADSIHPIPTIDPHSGRSSAAKSLFWKILPVSPCGSRFWPDSIRYPPRKFLRMNILENEQKKYREVPEGPEV